MIIQSVKERLGELKEWNPYSLFSLEVGRFKEELYLSPPQSKASQGLGQTGTILSSCSFAASCAQLLVAPDGLHVQIPDKMVLPFA